MIPHQHQKKLIALVLLLLGGALLFLAFDKPPALPAVMSRHSMLYVNDSWAGSTLLWGKASGMETSNSDNSRNAITGQCRFNIEDFHGLHWRSSGRKLQHRGFSLRNCQRILD